MGTRRNDDGRYGAALVFGFRRGERDHSGCAKPRAGKIQRARFNTATSESGTSRAAGGLLRTEGGCADSWAVLNVQTRPHHGAKASRGAERPAAAAVVLAFMAQRLHRSAASSFEVNLPAPSSQVRLASIYHTLLVITSLALPSVVLQLDGRGAKRLAMTLSGSFLFLREPSRLLRSSQ